MRNNILLLSAAFLLCSALPSYAQKTERSQLFSIYTNAVNWAAVGTVNGGASVALNRHVTVGMSGRYNPWTVSKDDRDSQFQWRERSAMLDVRYWPWYSYSGWWVDAGMQLQEYNRGGVFRRETEEGNAYGVSVGAGYTMMVSARLNVEFGAWLWSGWKKYVTYACPSCARVVDAGEKLFLGPDNVALSLVYLF